jgi:hypothetical protein
MAFKYGVNERNEGEDNGDYSRGGLDGNRHDVIEDECHCGRTIDQKVPRFSRATM